VDQSELSFFTNQQLIEELLRRTTFVGAVLFSKDPIKNGDWGDERTMTIQFNDNLSPDEAIRLFEIAAERVESAY